jgi:hypothetical protein
LVGKAALDPNRKSNPPHHFPATCSGQAVRFPGNVVAQSAKKAAEQLIAVMQLSLRFVSLVTGAHTVEP